MIGNVSVQELKDWLAKGEVTLVDVREPAEYKDGYIEGATLIPLATVALAKMPEHAGRKLVMQCRSGGRSRTACMKLKNEDPQLEVYNLEGGIMAWAQAGFEIAT